MILSLILVVTGAGGWDEALGAGLGFASVLRAFVGAGDLNRRPPCSGAP